MSAPLLTVDMRHKEIHYLFFNVLSVGGHYFHSPVLLLAIPFATQKKEIY